MRTGAAPDCVLVHGAGANRNYWKALSQALPGRNLICPDLYGHGETPAWSSVPRETPRYSYRDDVLLLEGLTEGAPGALDFVGHSSGGSVCLEYALKNPARVRKLILIEPMLPTVLKEFDPGAWSEVSAAYLSVRDKVARGEFADAAEELFEYILGEGQWAALPEKIRDWMGRNVKTTLAAHSDASLDLPTKLSEYRSVTTPTLVIAGEKTRTPYLRISECLSEALPEARLELIRGALHNSPVTHASEVNGLIARFLG